MSHSGQTEAIRIFTAAVESLSFFQLLTREPPSHIRLKITRETAKKTDLLESYRKHLHTVFCLCNRIQNSFPGSLHSFLPFNVQSAPETCSIIHHGLLQTSSIMDNTCDSTRTPPHPHPAPATYTARQRLRWEHKEQVPHPTAEGEVKAPGCQPASRPVLSAPQDPLTWCLSTSFCVMAYREMTALGQHAGSPGEGLEPRVKLPELKAT